MQPRRTHPCAQRGVSLDGSSPWGNGPLWNVGGAWVDINSDGLLDLIVVNYLSWNAATEPVCMEGDHRKS